MILYELIKAQSASYPSIDILTNYKQFSLSRQSDLDITKRYYL